MFLYTVMFFSRVLLPLRCVCLASVGVNTRIMLQSERTSWRTLVSLVKSRSCCDVIGLLHLKHFP